MKGKPPRLGCSTFQIDVSSSALGKLLSPFQWHCLPKQIDGGCLSSVTDLQLKGKSLI